VDPGIVFVSKQQSDPLECGPETLHSSPERKRFFHFFFGKLIKGCRRRKTEDRGPEKDEEQRAKSKGRLLVDGILFAFEVIPSHDPTIFWA